MQSRMAGLMLDKAAQSQKGEIFQKGKKGKPKPCISKTNLINLEGIPRTKITQTINHTTQLRVTKPLLWFSTIHLPITKHRQYRHAYLSQTISQALQGIITL